MSSMCARLIINYTEFFRNMNSSTPMPVCKHNLKQTWKEDARKLAQNIKRIALNLLSGTHEPLCRDLVESECVSSLATSS